ncbi:hypothetical protein [Micromonospora sp. CA-111912]|uniref:hypothetical protein n=1 Tax=Micromonospora sp. CA-111912 TaxID=3239955 RepID=UPI003D9331C9
MRQPRDRGALTVLPGHTYRPGIWPFQENKIALGCGFTGGSSGSVWLRLYNDAYGYVNGIMSTLDGNGVNRSSYVGTARDPDRTGSALPAPMPTE